MKICLTQTQQQKISSKVAMKIQDEEVNTVESFSTVDKSAV